MKAVIAEPTRAHDRRLPTAELKPARRASLDSDELQLYLNKLTHLVPNAPKHRRLTKLEVIQRVIDYICDLEEALTARRLERQPTPAPGVLSERQNTLHSEEVRLA